jgi:hypothetical protein
MTTPSSSGFSPELLAAAQRAREHWVQRAMAASAPAAPPAAPSDGDGSVAPAAADAGAQAAVPQRT